MNGQKIDGQEVQVSLAKPPSNKHDANNSVLNINQTNSFNQSPTMFGRINGVMMSRPTPATQPQAMLSQFSTPAATDFASIIRAQSAAKLQQSLRNLQPPPPMPSYLVQPPKLSSPSYPLLAGPKGDGIMGPISKSSDCGCNGKSAMTSPQESKDLVPVSTLDHIAKIQCPVVYLDEISTMFNNGIRPVYALYSDNSQGLTRYVYRITFMGECYTPPADRYCYTVPDAQRSAAEYVLRQIDPWLKKKITEVVQNSCSLNPPTTYSSVPSATPAAASGFSTSSNAGLYNATSVWGSAIGNKTCSYEAINRKPESQTSFNSLSSSGGGNNLMGGLTSAVSSMSASYGLTNSIWNQMRLADNYLTGNSYQKNSSPLMPEPLSSLKRTTPTFDRVVSPCNAMQALSLDG